MRRKKHKHTRRSVSFYKINHGFREPFKVQQRGFMLEEQRQQQQQQQQQQPAWPGP
jgi:U3 small nucleolar RNA-associated protein 23